MKKESVNLEIIWNYLKKQKKKNKNEENFQDFLNTIERANVCIVGELKRKDWKKRAENIERNNVWTFPISGRDVEVQILVY